MSENNYTVSVFKDIYDIDKPFTININKVFERIKNGKSSKAIIEKIIKEHDKKEQDKLKKKLPVICFTGQFSHRHNEGLIEHSGLICIDFDKVGDRMNQLRTRLENDKYTFACFLSPRRDGLKVIVKIPTLKLETEDEAGHRKLNLDHKSYFEGLRMYYKESTMDDDAEVARACFESYDENIFINQNSALFDIRIEPKVDVNIDYSTRKNRIKDPSVLYDKIKKWLEKNEIHYENGNKHRYLVALASACNRFGISQDITIKKVIDEFQTKADYVASEDFIDIVERVYISYHNQFDISWLTDQGEMNDFNPTGPARDVIYVKDIQKEMIKSFTEGDSKGDTTHFKSIDQHWTWKRGELTVMGGIPNHGKTTMMLQMCLIRSVREGLKWGVFSPEQNPPIDFYKDLIHTYIGKSTERYHNNQMSLKEFEDGMKFINDHFFFVYPKDDAPTPDYINERFSELIFKHKIDGCIIDPFNQLDNDWGKNGRDDHYISSFLSKEKRFGLEHNVYKIIIAHPKNNLEKKKNTNNYECPTEYNLAGGAMWANKCDNILATYRPYFGEDKSNPTVEFRSQKVKKQKYVGIPGTASLSFDIFSNRYIEFAEQLTVTENGRTFTKWVGISPFDADYEEKYAELSASRASQEANSNSLEGFKGLKQSNDITNQLAQRKIALPAAEDIIYSEESYSSDFSSDDEKLY